MDDYFRLVNCTKEQKIAYLILALTSNARIWWDAEMQSRGDQVPSTVAEFRMLLKAQFESPMREHKARHELCNLAQRKGESASAYMARTKALIHKVPGYDMRTALHQWMMGLRQPYRLEAAKMGPKSMQDAEKLVVRLEDALDFDKAGKDASQSSKEASKGAKEGNQGIKRNSLVEIKVVNRKGGSKKKSVKVKDTEEIIAVSLKAGKGHRLRPHVPHNPMLLSSTRVTEVVGLDSMDVGGQVVDDPRWL